ncbi:helix-turn-helix transcriptional regulator [Nonomuraea purpurea]|uniref:Helix-turn-helix transcriptional regulator n=1 Tax=Nonomuraea purpurea TaxID=1849276 RepID=A0ABV8G2T5_9ACTN
MLRTLREIIGSTQERLAESVGVDTNTIKGWETGRRPLINASGRTLYGLRRRLTQLGAPAELVQRLDTAMDADLFIAHALDASDAAYLGSWVATRAWSDLLAWVCTDRPPPLVTKHITKPPQPLLPSADRRRFFEVLRNAAESAAGENASAMLLRRQAYYMVAWDPESEDWLLSMERRELRHHGRPGYEWTPAWPLMRSIAVARACQGDPSLLHDFIDSHLADDLRESANLNYWSYWVEETAGVAGSDQFMADDLGAWQGGVLLRHLADGLARGVPYLSLSIRASRTLVERRPTLLMENRELAARLDRRASNLLDLPVGLPPKIRRDLENVHFAAKMAAGLHRSNHD